ncbi:2-methyl-6-phytylbenzoquinone methyltransferase [Pyrus ussuriensis x Pyrus communis]|uniref:2-methyl-6-phytylbenzoquinone methyltransferase n=1 Tax=Pyrus ussuriensis x Pyrus communis TaxID=2448454 RepID=A0A5N5FTM1_9ROSA|nr:2-methyl-6-phytylbenzoquinone methyltransferase [Pyrus ussuriensis x Pyrus communis]
MQDDALESAELYDRNMVVVDIGGGTGFTTLGIVKHVDAKNVTILDQSPHQLAKAKEKEPLKECRKIKGDVEDLSCPTDYSDRYVSAGRHLQFIYIEERRPNNAGVAARGRRRGRGRGGYQTDATRGHFGGRSSGRGSYQDGDYNRPRGNGFHQRGKATPPADTQ